MKKKIILTLFALVSALCCAFGLAACGGENYVGDVHGKHTFDQKVEDDLYLCTPLTCTEKATYYYSCECGACDSTSTKTFEGGEEPTGHVFEGVDYSTHIKSEATCTSVAVYYKFCLNCDAEGTETYEDMGPAEGHKYFGGKCSVCEAVQPISEGLEFVLSEDGASYGVKKGTCTDTQILIPATHEGKPVTTVCENAFQWEDKIKSVSLPDSITTIEREAFGSCHYLERINIPENVTFIDYDAFYFCSSLTSIDIPDKVTEIGGGVFFSCYKLKTVTIGSGLSTIGDYAFDGCEALKSLTVAADNAAFKSVDNCLLTKDGKKLISGCITGIIPDGVTTIGVAAFAGRGDITSVTIPESVTVIEDAAFRGCTGMKSITLPANLTSIGDYAFGSCHGLTSLVIPDKVTHLGSEAIYNCAWLESVVIPASVVSIESNNLSECERLEEAEIPYHINLIEDMSKDSLKTLKIVGYGTIEAEAFKDCTTLKVLDISHVSEIGEDAFSGCTSLEEVTMPAWVIKDIPQDSLKVVVITDGVEIEDDAFKGCSTLTHITLPRSLHSIGDGVFLDCPALELITFEGAKNQWEYIAYGKDWNPTSPLPNFRVEILNKLS